MEKLIHDILYGYIAQKSITATPGAHLAEQYFLDYFGALPYFKAHPDCFGREAVAGDALERAAVFAMVKGEGPDTIVMIHHYDVVGVEDFKTLKDYAFAPDALEVELRKIADMLPENAKADLLSGDWLFGRGGCDMKGGGSIQMALLTKLAEAAMEGRKLSGNILVLGVPDEENLSAGMRAGVGLLARLKKELGLNYRLMVNSEPHQRKDPEKGIFSFGSIGKLMPFVYVRGFLSHAGKVFEGFNPSHLLSEIVCRTETNMDFSDVVGREAAPPPTWLYMKDSKDVYDVSMPLSAQGCLNVLTLSSSPAEVMDRLHGICEEAFAHVLAGKNAQYRRFLRAEGRAETDLPFGVRVLRFEELLQAAIGSGETMRAAYAQLLKEQKEAVEAGRETYITANFHLVDFLCDAAPLTGPYVVIGLIPPFYPSVANALLPEAMREPQLYADLNAYTGKTFGQCYEEEAYYTGISDLSYSGISDAAGVRKTLAESMPFFGAFYDLPLEDMESITMPCVNVGPWGKDFHKLTERVYKPDLYRVTPEILKETVRLMFGSIPELS